jgi:spore coat polysaccharide biosynthesis predicted glycosyltransferase SpsG
MKKIFIISDLGKNVGLGHYARSKVLTKEINFFFRKKVKIYNFYFSKKAINISAVKSIKNVNLESYIQKKISQISPDIIIFNISRFLEPDLYKYVKTLKINFNIKLVAIDGFTKKFEFFNYIWLPNPTLKYKKDLKNKIILYGWDKILIDNVKIKRKKGNKIKILFTLGATDKYKIGNKLPGLIEKKFDKKVEFLWIKGPYATKPKIHNKKRWKIVKNKFDLKPMFRNIDAAFVVLGVSFFEIMYQGIPSVAFFHKKKVIDFYLASYLKKKNFDITSSLNKAVNILHFKIKSLKKSNEVAKKLSINIKFKNRKKFLKKILFIK